MSCLHSPLLPTPFPIIINILIPQEFPLHLTKLTLARYRNLAPLDAGAGA